MKTYLWLAVTVGQACLLGCAQQQLGGGPRDGGPGVDAGCGPPGKLACSVATGCTTTAVAPICVNGSWTCPPDRGTTITCEPPICPASPLPGCTCDPATGVTTCRDAGACPASAPDGAVLFCVSHCSDNTVVVSTCDGGVWSCPPGTVDLQTCGSRDATTGCAPNGQEGPAVSCVDTCNIDSSPVAPVCVNGAWICQSGRDVRTCCHGTAPPGCRCDPLFSVLTCAADGGADAASAGHGG
jgi:hypothetical protein